MREDIRAVLAEERGSRWKQVVITSVVALVAAALAGLVTYAVTDRQIGEQREQFDTQIAETRIMAATGQRRKVYLQYLEIDRELNRKIRKFYHKAQSLEDEMPPGYVVDYVTAVYNRGTDASFRIKSAIDRMARAREDLKLLGNSQLFTVADYVYEGHKTTFADAAIFFDSLFLSKMDEFDTTPEDLRWMQQHVINDRRYLVTARDAMYDLMRADLGADQERRLPTLDLTAPPEGIDP